MKKLVFDPPANKAVTTESSLLLDLDSPSVKYHFVEFINISATIVFLAFGNNPAELDKGTPVMPNGGVFTLLAPYLQGYGKINVISQAGGETICITTAR